MSINIDRKAMGRWYPRHMGRGSDKTLEGRGISPTREQSLFTSPQTAVQLFRNSTQEARPFLVLNLSLPPEER